MIVRVPGEFWRRELLGDREFMGPFFGKHPLEHNLNPILHANGIHHSSRLREAFEPGS
jgi:hypothetical protein